MQVLSRAEVVILGLLSEGPLHAYELEKRIRQRELRHWARVAFSSLYRVADGLEKRGLLESRREGSPGRPARRVFSLTATGWAALAARVREAIAEVPDDRAELGLALMFGQVLEPGELRASLRDARDALAGKFAALKAKRRAAAARYPHALVDAIFLREIATLEAERRWASDLLRRLESEAAAVPEREKP